MAPSARRIVKAAVILLKIAVSGSLLYLLISRVGGDALLGNLLAINPLIFLAAMGLYVFSIWLSARRWKILIPYPMGLRRLFGMYMIGSFFNTCLPGVIGGDAVKAFYLNRSLKGRIPEEKEPHIPDGISSSIASVFMDRYIGYLSLILMGMAALPFGWGYLTDPMTRWALPLLLSAFVVASLFMLYMPFSGRIRFLSGVGAYIKMYRTRRRELVRAFWYSVALQMCGMAAVYLIAGNIGVEVPLVLILISLPLISTIALLPVSISGIGVREGAFVYFFGMAGISPDKAMTISLLWFLSTVAASLWGLIEYLRFKAELGSTGEEQAPDAGG